MRKPENCQHEIEITTCRSCFRELLIKEENKHSQRVNKAERNQS